MRWLAFFLTWLIASSAWGQTQQKMSLSPPSWVLKGAAVQCDFANYRWWNCDPAKDLSITRASTGTDLTYLSAQGASFNTFASGQLRITPGVGLLIEEGRTNSLLNSGTPATQTTASLAAATYTLWVNGSGSATMSSGTGVGCGTGVATQGTTVSFTITTAGTCTVTVAGSLNQFQLENGAFATSYIPTTGSTATRAADSILFPPGSKSYSNVGPVSGAPGTIWMQTYQVQSFAALAAVFLSIDNSASSALVTGGSNIIESRTGGVNVTATCGGSNVFATNVMKFANSYGPNSRVLVCNGGTPVGGGTSLNAAGPHLGSQNNGNFMDGWLQSYAEWNYQIPFGFEMSITQ